MKSAAYISKQNDQFIVSIAMSMSGYASGFDTAFSTLFDALLFALNFDPDIHVTLDAWCDAIAYLGVQDYINSAAN